MDEQGKILGLDLGLKKTGVAISDESHTFSFPLVQFEAKGVPKWLENVLPLIDEHEVCKVVVGVPLDLAGEKGAQAKTFEPYINALRKRVKVPVIEWDERLTTAQAERSLITANVSRKKRKNVVDKVAAVIILQSYLDSLQFETSSWDPE